MKNEQYDKICAWLDAHRGELIEDLIDLVNVKSVKAAPIEGAPFGKGCREVLDLSLEMGKSMGLIAQNFDNYVGRLALREGPADIGIWGHLDVVPEGDNWQYEPYNAIEKDGFVIGRGAGDNKGSCIAAMYVLRAFKELGIETKKNIAVFLGTNEEAGMDDVIHYVNNYDCPDFSLVPDCGFPLCFAEKGIIEARLISMAPLSQKVIELSGGIASNVVPDEAHIVVVKDDQTLAGLDKLPEGFEVQDMGSSVRITAFGITGHTAFPGNSINAVRLLTDGLLKAEILPSTDLDALYFINRVNDDTFGTTLHIDCSDDVSGRLTCVGSLLTMRQDRKAQLIINIRYPVKADSEKMINSIETTCAQNRFQMELIKDSRPAYVPPTHPVVEKLVDVYNSLTGEDAKPYSMAGGTYARKLPNAVGFGMGWPTEFPKDLVPEGHGGAHTPDEAVSVDNLIKGAKVYVKALLEMDEMNLKA